MTKGPKGDKEKGRKEIKKIEASKEGARWLQAYCGLTWADQAGCRVEVARSNVRRGALTLEGRLLSQGEHRFSNRDRGFFRCIHDPPA